MNKLKSTTTVKVVLVLFESFYISTPSRQLSFIAIWKKAKEASVIPADSRKLLLVIYMYQKGVNMYLCKL
ncbi:unnamed protein product [Rhizophagus irregularis]|nr:unnamed protein product [Rhizophagus irregularis]